MSKRNYENYYYEVDRQKGVRKEGMKGHSGSGWQMWQHGSTK